MEVQQRLLIGLALAVSIPAGAQKFYPDDPIWQEPKPIPVTKAFARKLSDYYDLFWNTLARPGEKQSLLHPIHAQGVNTLGEVPDSAWYTNRHGRKPMSLAELVQGPNTGGPPAMTGHWKVMRVKTDGITPGFSRVMDSQGRSFVVKFDPLTNPEMATAADVVGATFFHALGYWTPQYYVVSFDRQQLEVTPKSTYRDAFGKTRKMTEMDVDEVLLKVPRGGDGKYRAVASPYVEGQELGPFRYHGTRKDDPNDVIPHERRRDLRGLFVFCAWLGHDDSRSINTYDALTKEGGVPHIRHYLMDFGSILGSASTKPNSARSGNEHLFSMKPALAEILSIGLYLPGWTRAHFPEFPAVGRFEHEIFDPEEYKTEYPNPAFENRLPDDTFWAAKQVMRFTDEQIRAIVKKGEYSDPKAEAWTATCLIARRNKVGRTYFAKVLPLDGFEVRDGILFFEDLAAKYGFAPSREYKIQWSRFDNSAQRKSPLPDRIGPAIPPEVRSGRPGEYFAADIISDGSKQSVTAYLRYANGRLDVVGIDRTW